MASDLPGGCSNWIDVSSNEDNGMFCQTFEYTTKTFESAICGPTAVEGKNEMQTVSSAGKIFTEIHPNLATTFVRGN